MADKRGTREPAGNAALGAYRSVNDLLAENDGEARPAMPGRMEHAPGTDFYMGVFTSVMFLVPVGVVISVAVFFSAGTELFSEEPRPITYYFPHLFGFCWVAILLSFWLYRLVQAFRARRSYFSLGMLSTLLAVFLLFGACTVFVREAEITISGKRVLPRPAQMRQGECRVYETLQRVPFALAADFSGERDAVSKGAPWPSCGEDL